VFLKVRPWSLVARCPKTRLALEEHDKKGKAFGFIAECWGFWSRDWT
jgi:hypothetical protein